MTKLLLKNRTLRKWIRSRNNREKLFRKESEIFLRFHISVICRIESMIRCCAAARIDMPIDAYVFPYDVLYNGILFGIVFWTLWCPFEWNGGSIEAPVLIYLHRFAQICGYISPHWSIATMFSGINPASNIRFCRICYRQ